MTRVHALFFVLVALHHRTGAQDACLTPNNKNGICINIQSCQPLLEILRRSRPLPAAVHDFLNRSQCGFEGMYPKVCCQTQTTGVTPSPPTPSPPTPTPEITPKPQTSLPAPPDVSRHPNLRLINSEICGPITESKIFGGNRTRVLDYPWMALLGYNTGKPMREYLCGGSVISKRYVLTAAHCVTALNRGITLIGVRLGEHNFTTERDCDIGEGGIEETCADRYQDFGLESVHSHPGFSLGELQNDIALIRLNRDADFRVNNVKPVCMPAGASATMPNKKVTVTGWGATEEGVRSQGLLQVRLSPVSGEDCQKVYRSKPIWYKQICAGGTKNMDSCLGDSGGPLQVPTITMGEYRFVQYGIVSYGVRNCGTEGIPGVYTRVSHYMDWVLDNMRD